MDKLLLFMCRYWLCYPLEKLCHLMIIAVKSLCTGLDHFFSRYVCEVNRVSGDLCQVLDENPLRSAVPFAERMYYINLAEVKSQFFTNHIRWNCEQKLVFHEFLIDGVKAWLNVHAIAKLIPFRYVYGSQLSGPGINILKNESVDFLQMFQIKAPFTWVFLYL